MRMEEGWAAEGSRPDRGACAYERECHSQRHSILNSSREVAVPKRLWLHFLLRREDGKAASGEQYQSIP